VSVRARLAGAPTDAAQANVARSGPTLNGMRIPDAVNVYLNWARDQGRDRVTLGDLADALGSGNIVSALGKPIGSPWKPLTNTLAAPGNSDAWRVRRGSSDRFLRSDTIELSTLARKT
jgi:hypothetical protein